MTRRIWPALLAIAMLVPAAPAQARPNRLVSRRTVKAKAHLRVPVSASGRYRLLACVEKVKTRGKRKLSAPCRAAAGTLTVPAPAAPAPVSSGGPPAPGGSPAPTPTPTPQTWSDAPATDPATPLATANPLDVTPVLYTGDRAVATIGAAGGTLDATGADGTAYKLTIPAGALVSDADLSMTPVSSIGGLPFDSLVGAVDLQPDGLQLLTPARSSSPRRAPRRPPTSSRSSPYQGEFLDPFSNWIYKGEEFPWATAFEPTIEEGLQSYDGQLQLLLTHDPTP